jgi:hypothetical protein
MIQTTNSITVSKFDGHLETGSAAVESSVRSVHAWRVVLCARWTRGDFRWELCGEREREALEGEGVWRRPYPGSII